MRENTNLPRLWSRPRKVLRNASIRARLAFNSFSAPRRTLPDFLIIGAQKTGTTSLLRYLSEHPCLLPSTRKEVHYFDLNYTKGINWYRRFFPLESPREPHREQTHIPPVVGEATPYYLFHPAVPKRVAACLPDVRLIVILRDPVARAWSHYWHSRRSGREALSFGAAIQAEAARLSGEADRLMRDESYVSASHLHHSYVTRGHYAVQLKRWLAHFPASQLLIIDSHDLFRDARGVLARTAAFLGLPPFEPGPLRVHAAGSYDARMATELRLDLEAHFAPHNHALEELTGHQFSWGTGLATPTATGP